MASVAVLISAFISTVFAHPSNFTYNRHEFLLNGDTYQMIGGQMDPQRIPRPYWRQRLQMARAMGLNTIFTYIFWNNLEPSPGQWDFSDRNDIAAFFRIAQQEGLHVVLRPGPYICGEREWGGFPAWLSEIPGMAVRQNNGPFLDASKKYIDRLGEELRGLQVTNGGPILMVQLENEYGSFGKDKQYLSAMANMLRDNFDIFLYTNDGGGESYLLGGYLPGILAVIDGDPKVGFAARDKYITDPTCLGPQLDGEYYITWIDNWASNSSHHYTSGNVQATEKALSDLDWILAGNNSFAIYMFHGGTNWGFENGGIWGNGFLMAVTSSYDYGAPLDESGRPTQVYHQIRDLISKYVPKGSIPEIPSTPSLVEVPQFSLEPVRGVFEHLEDHRKIESRFPKHMEALGQSYGFVMYEHIVTEDHNGKIFPGDKPRDRVIAYVNGARVGVIDNTYAAPATVKVALKKGDKLQLLVENLGRVDFNQPLKEQRKGVIGNVTIGDSGALEGWSMYSMPLDKLPSGATSGNDKYEVQKNGSPAFYRGSFKLPAAAKTDLSGDTFLELPLGVKGVAWVNGIMLGRYWAVGPQQSLYVPGCYLHGNGRQNEVVVMELQPQPEVQLQAKGIAVREWSNKPDPDAPKSN